jgi:WD40 repeat protein
LAWQYNHALALRQLHGASALLYNHDKMSESTPGVFISYGRSDDEPFVERLRNDLESQGIHVWWDRQSMSNRGLTFLDEIQRAIEAADRVIAVVGPHALKSDYVMYEWDYALLFGKAVVPVLRLGDYTSLPGNLARDLRNYHCPDFRPERPYDQAFQELLRILSDPVLPFGPIRGTPALPACFLPRREILNAMRQALYADLERPRPAASASDQTLVLYGMGGSGKSVLATAFARSTEVRRAASDGIVWLKAGRDLKPGGRLANLRLIGTTFDDDRKYYINEKQARARISQLLNDKACLIVVDDVWSKDDAEPYLNALGPRCRLLVTTRDAALAAPGKPQPVGVLDPSEALTLLSRSSGQPPGGLPSAARAVAEECGNLPLALNMIGAMVAGNSERWDYALRRLRALRLDKIQFPIPNYDYPDLLRAIQVSVDDLTEEQQARYLELAVFPAGAAIPEETLRVLWGASGVDADDATELIDLYIRRSLARRIRRGRVALHQLQSDYVRARAADLPALHGRFVDAYAARCSNGFPSGPDDGYYFQFLFYNLSQAGRNSVLRDLLRNYHWLDSKLRVTSIVDLIADYDYGGNDPGIGLVRQTLRLAAAGLARDRSQLRTQLYARLQPFRSGGLEALVADAEHAAGPWLKPLVPALATPGGPLIRTLAGHEAFVNAIAIFDAGRRAISGSDDRTARVWDLENGTEIMRLSGHSNVVTAVAVTSDGGRAVTAPWDYTLKLWDLYKGNEIRTIECPKAKVHALQIAAGDQLVVAGLSDGTIRMWSLEDGRLIATLEGHTKAVRALEITPDGQTLLSGSEDCRIGIWNFADHKLLRFLKAHEKPVIGLLADNESLVSASTDNTLMLCRIATGEQWSGLTGFPFYSHAGHPIALCPDGSRMVLGGVNGEIGIWEVEKGAVSRLAEGHTAWITAVEALPDNRGAVSASGDKTLKIWNLEARSEERRPAHAYFATCVSVRAGGREAISASPRDGLMVWDLSTLELIRSIPIPSTDRVIRMVTRAGMSMSPGDFLVIALFPDGRHGAWALQDETVRITDLDTSEELARRRIPGAEALAVTPDGRQLICVATEPKPGHAVAITIWDWKADHVSSFPAGGSPYLLRVSPDGRRLLSSSWFGKTVEVFDLPSGAPLVSFASHADAVTALALSPDSRIAYSGGRDRTIRAWNLDTAEEILALSGHEAAVYAVALFPDGRRLVSASDDCSLKVWDLAGRRTVAGFTGDVPFRSCAVARDGLIIAGDNLGRIHFLRLEDGSG